MSETDTDEAAAPTPEEGDAPRREEETSAEATPETATATVEPRLGLSEFAGIAGLSTPAQAALKRWMDIYVRVQASSGHYSLAQWQEYHRQMRAHT